MAMLLVSGSEMASVSGLALGSQSGSESDLVLVLRSGWVPAMAMLLVSGSAMATVSGWRRGRVGVELDLVLVFGHSRRRRRRWTRRW